VLEAAGKEAKSFFSKTVQSLVKWAVLRVIDFIAPGIGAVINACERVISIAQAARAAVEGSGDVGFPVCTYDGFEFRAEVHVGNDPAGRSLPVSGYIAPSEGGSVFDQVDIASDSHNRYAAMITTDLSRLSCLPDPVSRAGVIRSYTDQEILPGLRHRHHKEVELLYVYDKESGYGAWMRVRSGRTSWCLFTWRSAI
jgi:hypothetical protein